MEENKQILDVAKREVRKKMGNNGSLKDISNLQSARLDQQIQQFEELQRVLVKI